MQPVKTIAIGLLVVVAGLRINGFDLLADPLGWLVVLVGLTGLPTRMREGKPLFPLAALALVVSVPMWFLSSIPDIPAEDAGLDQALLATLVTLPETAFLAVLCGTLAGAAAAANDPGSAGRFQNAATLVWATLAIPAASLVLLHTVGIVGFVLVVLAGFVVYVYVLVLLFTRSGRPWAVPT